MTGRRRAVPGHELRARRRVGGRAARRRRRDCLARRTRPRAASTRSSSPAASRTATTCAPARSPGSRRSWTRSPSSPPPAGPVVGICNGFQVLTEAGLLPGALQKNAGLKFLCETVELRVETTRSVLTSARRRRRRAAHPDQPLRGQLRVRRGDARRAPRRRPRRVALRRQPERQPRRHRRHLQRGPQRRRASCRTPSAASDPCSARPTASCCCARCSHVGAASAVADSRSSASRSGSTERRTTLGDRYAPRVMPAFFSTSAGTPSSRQVAYEMPLRSE